MNDLLVPASDTDDDFDEDDGDDAMEVFIPNKQIFNYSIYKLYN